LDDAPDDPNPPRQDDGVLTTELVGECTNQKGANEGTTRHGSDNTTLRTRAGISYGLSVEFIGKDTGHRRDIEAKQASADTGEGAHDVLEHNMSIWIETFLRNDSPDSPR
jgi:hypothetical protein